jgi:hypothetical protein
MIEYVLGFVAGMFFGAGFGVLVFAACAMSGLQDDIQERHQ